MYFRERILRVVKEISYKKSIKSFKPAFLLVFSKSEISPKEPPDENFAISLPALLLIYENYVQFRFDTSF